jgi:hypothetical protein
MISDILAMIATQKGQFALGCFAARFDEKERRELLAEWV